jgi:predicted amidohydrolase
MNLKPYLTAVLLIFAKVLAQGRSLTVAALLVGRTVCSQQSRDRQGALRAPNLQILLQRLIVALAISSASAAPARLKLGLVQMALGPTIAENRDRITAGISNAAVQGVRVVVFPEGALRGKDGNQPALVDQAVAAIRQAARESKVYVLLGGSTYAPALKKDANWMLVLGPEGGERFRYEKLYDNHRATMPGVFDIDGIPCSAMICADRWLRGVAELPIQQGAQISFELSCNFASEWVAPLEWYWYVPRALRNNVWVVFANTGNQVSGVPDDPAAPAELRHGHSAIIAPDGRVLAASRNDTETIVVADLEPAQATRAEARARSAHPALRSFWEAGLKLHQGQAVTAPAFTPLASQPKSITIAAAQVIDDLSLMQRMIVQAQASNADLVVFPERAISEAALSQLQDAARTHRITVVCGMEHRVGASRRNSAFVIGPDGSLLTRYDQLSATGRFDQGADPAAMWFRVKGVPAVVTIGRDALWTELAELAAVAGAQIHVHLDHDSADTPDLRRLQVWSNLASYLTFTATVNVAGSTIWDDLRGLEETRAEVRGLPRPDTGPVEVYSPFSANIVVRATHAAQLIVATRTIPKLNPHHPRRTTAFNPQMEAWYGIGAESLHPK